MHERDRTDSGCDRERTCRIGPSWRVVLTSLVLIAAGGATARAAYWNLFNIEGESRDSAAFATYATLTDMLKDENRLDVFYPNGGFVGRNVVGTGSDGATYWNLFNIEGESTDSAAFATYATLSDMLNDVNRLDVFYPSGGSVGRNVVGTGSDGPTYWNLFNIEGESRDSAAFATYATLSDMLNDVNRLDVFYPDGNSVGRNIVGTGADIVRRPPATVPEPGAIGLLGAGLAALALIRRRRAIA
jgi:hypothetical protein